LNLPIIGDVIREVGNIIDDVVTTDEERMRIELQYHALGVALQQSQIAVNLQEAKHPSIFVAGWRPFIGWGCGAAIWHHFVIARFIEHMAWIFGYVAARPEMNITEMLGLTATLLGSAYLRNEDKKCGTDTKGVV